MPKNDNAHAVRLRESLEKHGHEAVARELAESCPLSKTADIEKKFRWAQRVCAVLEAHLDEAEIMAVRRACRCNDGKANAQRLLKYTRKAASVEAFVRAFNQGETFASLEYVSERELLLCYPQCYCACIKRVPHPLSRTWCYCTLGNAQGMLEAVFGPDVRVTLLETIKSGAQRCAIRVEW